MTTQAILARFRAKAASPKGSSQDERDGYASALETMGLNTKPERPLEQAVVDLSGGIHGASFTWENHRGLSPAFLAGARQGLLEAELVLAGVMDGLDLDVAADGDYTVPRAAFP